MITKPSDIHAELTGERIDLVGNLIAKVRYENIDSADIRDDGWSLGCRAHAWCRSEISRLSASNSWLKVINPTLKFIFTIGDIEISFYKGLANSPNKNILSRAQEHPELRQFSLLANFDIPDKTFWAFAVETDVEGQTTSIEFFGMSESGEVIASHSVPLEPVLSKIYPINPPHITSTNLGPAPVSLPSIDEVKASNIKKE